MNLQTYAYQWYPYSYIEPPAAYQSAYPYSSNDSYTQAYNEKMIQTMQQLQLDQQHTSQTMQRVQHDQRRTSQFMQQLQHDQQRTSQSMLHLQRQLTDIQSAVAQMNQNRQPSNTYVHNDFDKFEIFLDSISVQTLSGSLQIGLFNGSAATGALPPVVTTTNITSPPHAQTAPGGTQAAPAGGTQVPAQVPDSGAAPAAPEPTETLPAGEEDFVGNLIPGSPIPQGFSIPPGLPLPPGSSIGTGIIPFSTGEESPSSALPAGVTVVPPGMSLPPGAVEIGPGLAVLPPGTSLIAAGSGA
ncbi:hypothetical protein ACFPYJ_26045 [Paenibacillus solisilvae]|uniref:Uncharacterized protein n=1 Tax=Paenibacillus solisilvae TaxID=2486751 RepID=A0ABW0W505_9BACL